MTSRCSAFTGSQCVPIVLILLLAFAICGVSKAATFRVPEEYSTITQATNVAVAGDSILVNDGTYYEEVTVNPGVTLLSVNGAVVTKIKSPDTHSNAVRCPSSGGDSTATVSGFRISPQEYFSPPPIDSSNPNTIIEHCVILGGGPALNIVPTVLLRAGGTVRYCDVTNFSQSSMFLSVTAGAYMLIEDTIIDVQVFPNGVDGFNSGSLTVFKNNSFRGITEIRFEVIVPGNPTDFTMLFVNNIFGLTVFCDSSTPHVDSLEFRYNCFAGFLPFDYCPETEGPGNFVADPLYCEGEDEDSWLKPASPCIGAGEFGEDMGARLGICSPGTYSVSPDGTGDFPTIQEAISSVGDQAIIELADGVYTGPGNRDVSFEGKTIVLRSESGDPTSCVIDCEGTALENHRGLLLQGGQGFDTKIDGITIRNGYSDMGGAMWFSNFTEPQIEDCIFANNTASYGGAIYCWEALYTGRFLRCLFYGNTANVRGGAMDINWAANPIVENCTFYGNSSPLGSGIGVRWYSDLAIQNSIFSSGIGGEAVHCELNGAVTLTCTDIYGNEGGDWTGCASGYAGINGNFSQDPLFCDPEIDNFSLAADSPCHPDFSPCGELVGALGDGCIAVSVPEDWSEEPGGDGSTTMVELAVSPLHSNPVRESLALSIETGIPGRMRAGVYDASGRHVATFLNSSLDAGETLATWDLRDGRGRLIENGVYWWSVEAAGKRRTGAFVVVR